MYDALYARQSIEKKDSISVESQLESCRYETHGEACIEYTDRVFSGKDTNRPGFEKMMNDIRAGKIKRVIVYKLDRISRSILDLANIYNPASDFTGYNACYLYKGTVSTSRKQSDLSDKEIVLAPHKGFIPSKTWLACRIRCLNNRQSTKTCKPKNSWLVDKVKCGKCGYALTIRKAKTKWGRYFVCSQSGSRGSNCTGAGCTVYADVLEEYSICLLRSRKDCRSFRNFPVYQTQEKNNQT